MLCAVRVRPPWVVTVMMIIVSGLLGGFILSAPASHADSLLQPHAKTDPRWPVDTRGDGCSTPIWPDAKRSDGYRRLLVVGDSLIRNSRTLVEDRARSAGWIPTVRCWGAKGTDWGLAQIKRAKQMKQLPRTVVISLGTNDIWWLGLDLGAGVDAIMAEVGPRRQIYWVDLWFGPHGYDRLPTPYAANRLLREKAKEYPNLTIVRFSKAFKKADARDPAVGWEDGVHLNEAGRIVRVDAIMKAIGEPAPRVKK